MVKSGLIQTVMDRGRYFTLPFRLVLGETDEKNNEG
jgi:hypothetical protein